MKLKPIKTKKIICRPWNGLRRYLMQKREQKKEMLETLGILIEKYEEEHFPIDMPDPIEAIKFRMEQLDYNQNDLADLIGQKSRASEILNRKRKLSLDMIRKLSATLRIPSEVLIQAY
ncbi:helix-turn-helix domain-containing protein [Niabella aquatica]